MRVFDTRSEPPVCQVSGTSSLKTMEMGSHKSKLFIAWLSQSHEGKVVMMQAGMQKDSNINSLSPKQKAAATAAATVPIVHIP